MIQTKSMKSRRMGVSIKDLFSGFQDNQENGVVGYFGSLNIRPPYQREFVYKINQRVKVIETIINSYPLNTLYFYENNNETYEVLDGQQRILSICDFIDGNFSIEMNGNTFYFKNLPKNLQDAINNYSLDVCVFSEGTDQEKLDTFKTINIAGEVLTEQELRNSVYTGPWLSSAKDFFSKTGCAAYRISVNYTTGTPIRQEILELALKWISQENITGYMSKHQLDADAKELIEYFKNLIKWIESTFTVYDPSMKKVDWGPLYKDFKDSKLDSKDLAVKIKALLSDEDVTNKSGVYEFVLTNNESSLSIRKFNPSDKSTVFHSQEQCCNHCKKTFTLDKLQADHIIPWSHGGRTIRENCQLLCVPCHKKKGVS